MFEDLKKLILEKFSNLLKLVNLWLMPNLNNLCY